MKTLSAIGLLGLGVVALGCGEASSESASENLISIPQKVVCASVSAVEAQLELLDDGEGVELKQVDPNDLRKGALDAILAAPDGTLVFELPIKVEGSTQKIIWIDAETILLFTTKGEFIAERYDDQWTGSAESCETGDTDLRAELDAAVEATQIDLISEYGRGFSFVEFPAETTFREIYGDVSGEGIVDYLTDEVLDDRFSSSRGADVVTEWAAEIREEGQALSEGEVQVIIDAFDGIASAGAEYFSSDLFESVEQRYHGIAEDGDTEYSILIGTKEDGSIEVLAFSSFPF